MDFSAHSRMRLPDARRTSRACVANSKAVGVFRCHSSDARSGKRRENAVGVKAPSQEKGKGCPWLVTHRGEELYKIFGPRGEDYVKLVENGMGKGRTQRKARPRARTGRTSTFPCRAGCITVVMGLSGSGKSTLIRHINRLIDPTSGEVLYDGVDVCKMNENDLRAFRRHKTAMVFQKFATAAASHGSRKHHLRS